MVMKLVGVSGYVHTVEDSSCTCMKIIPGRASAHSVNQSINQSINQSVNQQSINLCLYVGWGRLDHPSRRLMYVRMFTHKKFDFGSIL